MAPPEPDFQVLTFSPVGGKAHVRKYQKRKGHFKSKSGCGSCKVKRVKCDEAKPCCGRCWKNKTYCFYPHQRVSATTAPQTFVSSLVQQVSLSALDSSSLGFDSTAKTPYGTPRIVLLHHLAHVFPNIDMYDTMDIKPIVILGISRPYLLDALLAVSASHLRHHTASPSPHRIAEHFQQSLAVKNFQTALSAPLDQQSSDALLLTSMMLNLLSFSFVEDQDPYKSWVFSDHADRLGWFSLQLGFKPLLLSTWEYRGESSDTILGWMFDASDDEQKTYHGEHGTLDKVPEHWLALCELSAESSPEDNIFYEPIRILTELKYLPPRPEFYFIYLAFVGKLDFDFRDLLEAYDLRAMWTLGYWLGLLCRFDHWWLNNRCWRDYKAIRIWLGQQDVRGKNSRLDGEMWTMLVDDLEKVVQKEESLIQQVEEIEI